VSSNLIARSIFPSPFTQGEHVSGSKKTGL